jgi:hypothetical protein
MDVETRKRVRQSLKRQGFDLTTSSKRGHVRPGCSQCQALVISGTACHETGCPNRLYSRKRTR